MNEVGRIIGGVYLPSIILISKLVVSLFIIISLMFINLYLSLILALIFSLSYLTIFVLFKKKLENIGEINAKTVYEKFKIVNESISSFKLLKIHKIELFFLNLFRDSSKIYSRTSAKAMIMSQTPRYLIETIAVGSVIIIILGILTVNSGYNVIPVIAIYAFAGLRLLPSFQEIYRSVNLIKFHYPIYENILNDLKLKVPSNDEEMNNRKIRFKNFDNIHFKNVSFKYENQDKYILDNITLKIPSKKTIGIIGKTGAGKTTLVDLFIGLLDPVSGKILIDDNNLTNNKSSWHNLISYVPQSPIILDGTILFNIAYAKHKEDIDKEKVLETIKISGLEEFIQSLPHGLDTYVGEKGVKLSGGQIQRVALLEHYIRNLNALY